MEDHRQFAGTDQVKKTEEVRQFLKQRSENEVVKMMLAAIDQDSTSTYS